MIVVVVALYSWFETLFLLSILLPEVLTFPTAHQAFIAWSQFLVIPGMEALFSRLMYGPQGWSRRAINIILAGSFGLALFLAVFFSLIAAIVWAASVSWVLFVVLFVILVPGFVFGASRVVSRISKRSVELETARWLQDKQRNLTATDRKCRNRGIRTALWIPSVTVLLVGIFLVQIWGVFSHVVQPRVGTSSRFRVPVPLTWVVLESNRQLADGYVWANGMAGQGSPLLNIFYPRGGLRVSEWNFRIQVSNESSPLETASGFPPREEVMGRHRFIVGSEKIECIEYLPLYLRPPYVQNSTMVFVECGGSPRFAAGFQGEKVHLPTFYRMLENTKELK